MFSKIIKVYKGASLPTKAAFWFAISNFLAKGMQFVSTPIFTRLMPEEEYGLLSVVLSYQQLFYILSTWEMALGAYQRGIFKYKETRDEYVSVTYINTIFLTVSFFAIVFCGYPLIYRVTGLSFCMIFSMFVYMLTYHVYVCWMVYNKSDYKYKNVAMLTILYAVTTTVFPIVAVVAIENTALVKYVFSVVPTALFGLIFFFKKFKLSHIINSGRRKWEYIRYNMKYQSPLIFHSLSYMVLNQSDRIMIGSMCGNTEAGYYSVAYNFAWVGILLQDSINQALIPWIYRTLEDKDYTKIKQISKCLIGFLALAILGYIFICPEIIKLLFEPNYYDAIKSMAPIGISVFFVFLYSLFVDVETYYNSTKYIMWTSMVCACVNIGLNYILIPMYGYVVCGYTTLFSYILFSVGHYVFMRRICRKNNIESSIFDMRFVLFVSVGVLICTILVALLLDNWILRYIILLCLIILTFVYRKKIIMGINGIKK